MAFDPSKRNEQNSEMQFNSGTEDAYRVYVCENAIQDNPDSVIEISDKFCWENHWMMSIGDIKGKDLDEAFLNASPKTVLELGTYCGYSAVRMARYLPDDGAFYSIDPNPTQAAVDVVAKAGLSDKVHFLHGTGEQVIPELKDQLDFPSFDLIFIDHDKSAYLSDLLLCEKHGLLHPGTTVIADNVVIFKIEDYLDHVRNSGRYSSSIAKVSRLEYDNTGKIDGLEISVFSG
eukprot:TRINITY_DN11909_c0_g1_i1.p1 TRINITY_DN11909_c0_g1~~TRINITY_DN11909_c0_g1_i1.p1  ORF type:complete len:232 (+),score=57.71 TRINITY_DN11909_c0_g1_i1:34-729(+)